MNRQKVKTLTPQPPVQINSLTGTYATSTYLAALKKSPKDLEALAKDIESFDKKIKEDEKGAAFIRKSLFDHDHRSLELVLVGYDG